ncbi:hypothetical protein A8E25_32615 [Burkholderia cenocepacia]|nr:hypothetical protein BURCENK562V_C0068 [Burkholderia cenocepacia K56-2Valvano]ERI28595.1 hypothetical protein BURCENBC7_AP0264 [Burkholderia cenocepacia BC7]ONR59029.1 hypothetical protein A8E17_15770 [Burkholderia cenocepacia]ONR61397.1 hypothetical protein A8E18_35910 [Burkholderia cenocepacia]ONR68528.1 hypothetical protein A8E23_19825 [Burkholderia cenocepacia]
MPIAVLSLPAAVAAEPTAMPSVPLAWAALPVELTLTYCADASPESASTAVVTVTAINFRRTRNESRIAGYER